MRTSNSVSRIRICHWRVWCALAAIALLPRLAAAQAPPDTTPPTIVAAATTEPNANGWYRGSVRVRFTCADNVRIASCPAAIVVATEGAGQVVSGTARDRAGNSATASITLNIDRTPPVVTAAPSPAAPASGWWTGPVTVTFEAADALSGLAPGTLTAPLTLLTDRANGSATGRATDLAGNVGTVRLTGINIDQKAPRVTIAFDPATTVRGYRNAAVTARFTCTDARSGIASCPADQLFPNDGRDQVVTGTAVDHAGHVTTVTRTLHIDATPPTLTITSPLPAAAHAGESITIAGVVADALSGVATLDAGGVAIRRRAGGMFSHGPVALQAGTNTFTLTATDRAGNAVQQALVVTVNADPDPDPDPEPEPEPDPEPVNLVQDPQFDAGVSGFYKQDDSSVVARSTESALEGASSLRVGIAGYGNNVWWTHNFAGGRASAFSASARLRSDAASGSDLKFCVMVYYAGGDPDAVLECSVVSGATGDKGVVGAALALDPERPLTSVNIRLVQEGGDPVSFTLDAAAAYLTVVEAPPANPGGGGGDPGGGGGNPGGGGGGGNQCTPNPNSVYPGFVYQLPALRPFISLEAYTQVSPSSTVYQRLRAAADAALAGHPPYAYSATHSVLAHALIGQGTYLADAIARVEAFVSAAEAAIAAGDRPAISGDSYLEIGWFLEQLALTYDRGYDQLTPEQRQRWAALAEQSLFNLWHPDAAVWGTTAFPWSGWSICDPGNNYHFSFLRATMLWALASQNQTWFDFLQQQKFGPLLDYYAVLAGGGTREGTGYGTALNNLFGNFIYWKSSTGEDLAAITPHVRETIDYWVHATVPTLDRFAPIADLSRSSIPELYDYQENLIHQAVVLSAGTAQARRGTWWLQHNSVDGVAHDFNLQGDLLPYPDAPLAPTALMYHATGAGALFARTSWQTDATWMSFIAGKLDQSHAHQEQGSFTFFKSDWLAVTNNIWSYSGIHQEVGVHNTLRFERTDGSVIPQTYSSTVESTMTPSHANGVTTVTADLANAYAGNATSVQGWTRTLELAGDTLRVTDTCTVAAGVRPIFQLQLPAAPVVMPDGSIQAGYLRIVLLQPATVTVVAMDSTQFQKGHRLELTTQAGCGFSVELQALPNSTPLPNPDPDPNPDPNPNPTPNPSPGPAPTPPPTCLTCSADPVEPAWSELSANATRIKSPAQHMHFTAGVPLRILADVRDTEAWQCPPGHPPYVCPGTEVRFYVDGQLAATVPPSTTDFNLWEAQLPNGLPAGDHVLTVAYVPYNPATGGGGTPVHGAVPVTIHVDPPRAHASTVTLTGHVVLSGAAALDWSDATVIGNGFTVTSAPGYSGNVVIAGAWISGLGGADVRGMDVTTTGSVSIEGTVFEATGGMQFGVTGSGAIAVRNSELRANNLLTFVSSNPDVPVALELGGHTTGARVIQGNRLGAGILRVRGNGWQIGGLAAGEGNVLIGARAVLELVNSSGNTVQGNYLHHDYVGGFSQGFNLLAQGGGSQLVEHNVIRGGSWPVQGIGGEFRYNLVVDSGHNFWRSVPANTQIHHNVFAHASGPNTGYDGAIQLYEGQTGVGVYNNTFDGGGAIGRFDGPAFNIGAGALIASIRNNLFTGFSTVLGQFAGAFVSTVGSASSTPRVTSADYNAWHNPLAPGSASYLPGIVALTPGLFDVTGNPQLSGQAEIPYRISEGCLWLRNCTAGQVLSHYRAIYQPASASPLVNAADPADGGGAAIGAVGPDTVNPADRFGRIVP